MGKQRAILTGTSLDNSILAFVETKHYQRLKEPTTQPLNKHNHQKQKKRGLELWIEHEKRLSMRASI